LDHLAGLDESGPPPVDHRGDAILSGLICRVRSRHPRHDDCRPARSTASSGIGERRPESPARALVLSALNHPRFASGFAGADTEAIQYLSVCYRPLRPQRVIVGIKLAKTASGGVTEFLVIFSRRAATSPQYRSQLFRYRWGNLLLS
jgi:hypothetical protein